MTMEVQGDGGGEEGHLTEAAKMDERSLVGLYINGFYQNYSSSSRVYWKEIILAPSRSPDRISYYCRKMEFSQEYN